ncbi:MAG: hypothetical protein QOF89_3202 [Acidobacteriota bacterium]|nr:hypothetical protein [Acidobacteriota bacterium]
MPDFSIKIVSVAGGGAAFVTGSDFEGYVSDDLAYGAEPPAPVTAEEAPAAEGAPAAAAGAVFVPALQQAPQYSLITWNNTTNETHQPELYDGSFATDPILPGQSSRPDYYITAASPATIPYRCKLHSGENGAISVIDVVNLPPEGVE